MEGDWERTVMKMQVWPPAMARLVYVCWGGRPEIARELFPDRQEKLCQSDDISQKGKKKRKWWNLKK